MKLVVGLGNPGRKYTGTRHNIGWEVLARLAEITSAQPVGNKFEGEVREAVVAGEKLLLLAPHTFMNLSGRSVKLATSFYKLETEDLLVICDDFNIPVGELRIRARGSHGGQNGLADIANQLKTTEYTRLRVGIGPVPDGWASPDFVLGKFAKKEQDEIQIQTQRAAEAVLTWAAEGSTAAMNRFNGKN
ncbi:aminoacyl-tRNA hydrolase [Adhaeretor mobilis]|uniref:Peptidyl-tRNA hydrolase n=1 Tax=Adhaeretor mobilis TaxID=1930276 RepID=A0A517MSW4_9BACT|nr:aminoacyl-tRNA hydrolase [Adhaeretor mobilis]QDS97981.1 Peptidyl-tRNA hydrolase [Adhaeretor mobilis]